MNTTHLFNDGFTFKDKIEIMQDMFVDLDKATMYYNGEVDESLGTILRVKYMIIREYWENIRKEKLERITIDFSSFGGSVYAIYDGLDFYDELLKEGVLVDTKVHGVCMSAATILLAGGTGKRYATKKTKFMIHDMQMEGIGGNTNQTKAIHQDLLKTQTELYEFYVKFTNKEKTFTDIELKKQIKAWEKLCSKSDYYLNASEAKERGLFDEYCN